MSEAARAVEAKREPRIIKISGKRQITIPADIYKEAGFADYALLTWSDEGFTVQPVDVRDEDTTVRILRQLLAEGYNGEELINEYEKIKNKIASFERLIDEGLRDVEEGRVVPFDEMQKELRAKYGL